MLEISCHVSGISGYISCQKLRPQFFDYYVVSHQGNSKHEGGREILFIVIIAIIKPPNIKLALYFKNNNNNNDIIGAPSISYILFLIDGLKEQI